MDLAQAMHARHAVRRYLSRPLAPEAAAALEDAAARLGAEHGVSLRLVLNAPEVFSGPLARAAGFRGVNDVLVLSGKKGLDAQEAAGYCGEYLVLLAQTLGLNTCWVGGSYRKTPAVAPAAKGERVFAVIAVGYGAELGTPHRSRRPEEVGKAFGEWPDWFRRGVEAALLAPTAFNRQRFRFILSGDRVLSGTVRVPFGHLDLGIAKLHFELGSGKDRSAWIA